MSEKQFLDALADDPRAPRFDLLPASERAGYRGLIDAREALRTETVDPASLARLETRVQSGALARRRRRRLVPWLWVAAAGVLVMLWLPRRGDEVAYVAPSEESKPPKLKGVTEPTASAVRQVVRDLGDRWKKLQALPKKSIVVLEGEFDQIGLVLDMYRIPHTSVTRAKLLKLSLKPTRALLLSCGRTPGPLQKPLLIKRVKKFVEGGGWVVATDWALAPYLTEAIKPRIKEVVPKRRQGDLIIAVQSVPTNSPLLEGVTGQGNLHWWLEEASKFAQIGGVPGKKTRGAVLVRSDEMEKRFGSGSLVISIPVGKGYVVYSMAHIHQKRAKESRSIAAVHRILLNTILEATK